MDKLKGSRSGLVTAASLVIVLTGINLAQSIIVPLLLALFVAILSYPIVTALERLRLPQSASVFTAVAIILFAGTVLGQFINASIKSFTAKMPEYKLQLVEHLEKVPFLSEVEILDKSLSQTLTSMNPEQAMSIGVNLLSNASNIVSNTFLILLAAIFVLLEAKVFKEKIHTITAVKGEISDKVDNFIESVKGYMLIKTGVSLLTGAAISLALWVIGVEHFFLWGLLAFLLNYIPTIGSILAAIPAVCLAFVQMGSGTALIVAGVFVAVNLIIGNVIEPKFMGQGLGLSTTAVLLSLIFWGFILGSVGMLLSIPLTMVLKIASENSIHWNWLSVMLSDRNI